MGRRLLALPCALLAVLVLAAPASAGPDGPLAATCSSAVQGEPQDLATTGCYLGDVAVRDVRATCRDAAGDAVDPCADGATQAQVDAFRDSAGGAVLRFQHRLADDVGQVDAPWLGTHNSFNSVVEMGPTLSAMDSNQQLTLVQQLDLGVRSLELDVHRLRRASGDELVVCHGRGASEQHAGCTTEAGYAAVLGSVARWLDAHPREVVQLYVENHFGVAGSAAFVDASRQVLGTKVFEPGGSGCSALPRELTRAAIRTAGKQVLMVGRCEAGGAEGALVHDWSDRFESRPSGYLAAGCGGRDPDAVGLVRFFEDTTMLAEGARHVGVTSRDDGITAPVLAEMLRCGVDLVGLDQLRAQDARLDAAAWSFEPAAWDLAGSCAVQRAAGRWTPASCAGARRPACRRADGSWVVPAQSVGARAARTTCAGAGASWAVPRTAREDDRLRAAAGGDEVLLGLTRRDGVWTPVDVRG